MKSRLYDFLIPLLAVACLLSAHAETSLRVWTSQQGTKVVAKATELSGGKVTLTKRDGATVTLPLSALVAKDQLIVKNYFTDDVPERSEEEPDLENLPKGDDQDFEPFDDLPEEGFEGGLGVFQGPIKAREKSSYYVYLPTTLVKGQKAPVVFWTGHHEGHQKTLEFLQEGAEITGTVLGVSVEAHFDGSATYDKNLRHADDCLQHMALNLPIEKKWVFFAGNDSGGASAFYNSDRKRCAGAFTVNAFVPREDVSLNGRGFFFMAAGTQNRHRYRAAKAVNQVGDLGTYFPYDGNVSMPESHIGTHAMIWLYTRHLYSMSRLRSDEVDRFEARFRPWLDSHAGLAPWEALYFTRHLLVTCGVKGEFREFLLKLEEELREEPDAVQYLEARKALAKFAEKVYAAHGGAEFLDKNHTTPKIENEIKKLQKKFGDVPDLGDLWSRLALPTE